MEGFPRKEGFQGRSPAGVLHGCGAIGGEEGLEGLVGGALEQHTEEHRALKGR